MKRPLAALFVLALLLPTFAPAERKELRVYHGVMVGEVTVWLSEVPKLDKGFGIRHVDVPEH